MHSCSARLRALAVLAGAVFLAGCSSNNPFSPTACEDVAGLYEFTQYDFTPRATGIAPANVLERIVPGTTTVELFGGCDVLFRFQLSGEASALVSGRMNVSASRVRIEFNDPQGRLPRLLLRPQLTLQRAGPTTLSASGETVVNLAAYDPQAYAGLTEVSGTLRLTLRRLSS